MYIATLYSIQTAVVPKVQWKECRSIELNLIVDYSSYTLWFIQSWKCVKVFCNNCMVYSFMLGLHIGKMMFTISIPVFAHYCHPGHAYCSFLPFWCWILLLVAILALNVAIGCHFDVECCYYLPPQYWILLLATNPVLNAAIGCQPGLARYFWLPSRSCLRLATAIHFLHAALGCHPVVECCY